MSCGKISEVTFSSEAEAPQTWECRTCGEEAILLIDSEPVVLDRPDAKIPRSHWDMLLERRSRAELEELLEERLTYLRSRRGSPDASADKKATADQKAPKAAATKSAKATAAKATATKATAAKAGASGKKTTVSV